jgi:type II secretory pathway pseudopilin PulG
MKTQGVKLILAFTLVELLVIIVILGTLLSLLFPALSRAKEKGKITACMNNLNQIGYGLAIYADDYQQYPPGITTNSSHKISNFTGAIGGKTGTLIGRPRYDAVPKAEERPLARYIKQQRSFQCGADQGEDIRPQPLMPTLFASIGCSYQYNGSFAADALRGNAEHPDRLILLYEPPATPVGGQGGNMWYFQWHFRRGRGTIPLSKLMEVPSRFVSAIQFFDGHAAQLDFTGTLLNNGNPTAATPKWQWFNAE